MNERIALRQHGVYEQLMFLFFQDVGDKPTGEGDDMDDGADDFDLSLPKKKKKKKPKNILDDEDDADDAKGTIQM